MNATTLAIEIIKMEGVERSWNKKFYTTNEGQTSIYINGEKNDVTEMYRSLEENGTIYISPVHDEYDRLRSEINRAGLDAFINRQDKKEAMKNYINNL